MSLTEKIPNCICMPPWPGAASCGYCAAAVLASLSCMRLHVSQTQTAHRYSRMQGAAGPVVGEPALVVGQLVRWQGVDARLPGLLDVVQAGLRDRVGVT